MTAFVGRLKPRQVDLLQYVRPLSSNILSKSLSGWTVTELPLAATESGGAAVREQLRFQDYIYRRYECGELAFDVYVAHWLPGVMAVREVAAHTPDRCWTESGWKCNEMQFDAPFILPEVIKHSVEYRRFVSEDGGKHVTVWYWHIAGGRLYNYGMRFNSVPHLGLRLRDLYCELTEGDPEQIFVRVTTSATPERLKADPAFGLIVRQLNVLCHSVQVNQ